MGDSTIQDAASILDGSGSRVLIMEAEYEGVGGEGILPCCQQARAWRG